MKLLQWFHPLSLTAKLVILLLPLAAVPPTAIIAQWSFFTRGELEEEMRRSLSTRAEVVEREVIRFIQDTQLRVREIKESPLFSDLSGYLGYGLLEEANNVRGKIGDFFVGLTSQQGRFARICLRYRPNNQGIEVLQGKPKAVSDLSSKECPFPSGHELIPPMQILPADSEIARTFARFSVPLIDPWSLPWAHLTLDLPFSEFSQLLGRLPLPDDGAGAILDQNGMMLACALGLKGNSGRDLCAELLRLKKEDNFSQDMTSKGNTRIVSGYVVLSRKLSASSWPWTIVLIMTDESYNAVQNRMKQGSYFAGGVFFVVALFALVPLTRRATAPLRRLEEYARRISSGDFQQKLPETSLTNDEIGRLAGAFNTMVDSLASRDLRLRQQAETLAARNEELSTLNRVISRGATTLQLDELLPALLDEILAAMGLKIGVIRLVDEGSGKLYLAAYRGLDEEYAKKAPRIPIGEEFTGRVALTGEPVFIPDMQNDPAQARLLSRIRSDEPLRGYAAVPIMAETQVIGVLAFGATGFRTFNQTDLSSLVSIGLGIGVCIRNARLYRELSEAYERMRMLQDHLIRTEKLSAMGQLIAGVAHEISNPLTTIMGYAQLLQGGVDNPETLEEIRTIIEQARRCARVVEKLLAFARETEKKTEVLDLYEVIGEVLEPAKLNLVLRSIDISDRRRPGLGFISGDRYQLQQVFLNLITNAQQAVEDQEPPRVLGIDLEVQGDRCVATISDNGFGIRPEVLRRVFDPFFTTKERGKGTGLGLSLSYGIVKDHGGEISIESEPGKGTRVSVQFPRISNAASEVPINGEASSSPIWPGRKILVIDDEPGICRFIEEALRRLQAEVHTAGTVKEALLAIRSVSPDLILSDIRLPDGDGFHILDVLDEANETDFLRLAFMSGDVVSEETRERLKKSGAPCLRKPFEVNDIQKFVSECLKRIESRPEMRH